MKISGIIFSHVLLVMGAFLPGRVEPQLAEGREPAVAVPATWHTDYQKALEIAKTESKELFVLFSGSDWCEKCILMQRRVFSSETFINYASKRFVLLQIDFPRKKNAGYEPENNDTLAARYNPSGVFPFMLVLTSGGETRITSGFRDESAAAFVSWLQTQ